VQHRGRPHPLRPTGYKRLEFYYDREQGEENHGAG
jgi:hypothetical protein